MDSINLSKENSLEPTSLVTYSQNHLSHETQQSPPPSSKQFQIFNFSDPTKYLCYDWHKISPLLLHNFTNPPTHTPAQELQITSNLSRLPSFNSHSNNPLSQQNIFTLKNTDLIKIPHSNILQNYNSSLSLIENQNTLSSPPCHFNQIYTHNILQPTNILSSHELSHSHHFKTTHPSFTTTSSLTNPCKTLDRVSYRILNHPITEDSTLRTDSLPSSSFNHLQHYPTQPCLKQPPSNDTHIFQQFPQQSHNQIFNSRETMLLTNRIPYYPSHNIQKLQKISENLALQSLSSLQTNKETNHSIPEQTEINTIQQTHQNHLNNLDNVEKHTQNSHVKQEENNEAKEIPSCKNIVQKQDSLIQNKIQFPDQIKITQNQKSFQKTFYKNQRKLKEIENSQLTNFTDSKSNVEFINHQIPFHNQLKQSTLHPCPSFNHNSTKISPLISHNYFYDDNIQHSNPLNANQITQSHNLSFQQPTSSLVNYNSTLSPPFNPILLDNTHPQQQQQLQQPVEKDDSQLDRHSSQRQETQKEQKKDVSIFGYLLNTVIGSFQTQTSLYKNLKMQQNAQDDILTESLCEIRQLRKEVDSMILHSGDIQGQSGLLEYMQGRLYELARNNPTILVDDEGKCLDNKVQIFSKYEFVLKEGDFTQPLVKDKNFILTVGLQDISNKKEMQNEIPIPVRLRMYTYNNPPNIFESYYIKGNIHSTVFKGTCSFRKIHIKHVTSHQKNRAMFLVVEPDFKEILSSESHNHHLLNEKTDTLHLPMNKKQRQLRINTEKTNKKQIFNNIINPILIKPLILEQIIVKSKKNNLAKSLQINPEISS